MWYPDNMQIYFRDSDVEFSSSKTSAIKYDLLISLH